VKSLLNLIRTEPAMIVAVAQTVIGLVVSLGFNVSADATAAVLAFTTALLAFVPAVLARPVQVSGITGLVSAGVTLLLAFGVHGIQPGLVASLNAAVVAVMAIILRGHLTPVASRPKPAPVVPAGM
jgi:hypothetical protein